MGKQSDKFGLYAWSINMLVAWIILLVVTIVEAVMCVSIFDGSCSVISGNLTITFFTLLFFIPPFVITEEVCRDVYVRNPEMRPLYAITLAYLFVIALIQISYAVFTSSVFSFIVLVLGRIAMCFFFYKHPLDRINA